MKGKLLSLVLLTVILSGLVFAADLSFNVASDLTKSKGTTSVILTNNANQTYNITIQTPINITDIAGKVISLSVSPTTFTLQSGTTKVINVSYGTLPSGIALGVSNTNLLAYVTEYVTENSSINATANINFASSYCASGSNSSILEITKIDDEELDNEDAWKWRPLDNVEVTVKVHNAGDNDLDVVVAYGLYNPATHSFADLDEDTFDLSIDSGKSEEATINFQIPSDIDEADNYQFYVKAYEEGKEKLVCIDTKDGYYYQTVQIDREAKAVVLDSIKSDSEYSCGDTVQVRTTVANIGTDDEDEVLVVLFNRELGVNMNKVIRDLESGDEQTLTFEFNLPKNATEKNYVLDLKAYYKYDDDNSGCTNEDEVDCYDKNTLDDMDRSYSVSFSVANCVKPVVNNVAIAAVLESDESEVRAGNQIVIKASLTNTGDQATTYIVDLDGEESFAKLVSIEPLSLTLNKGESKEVLITLKLNSDSAGQHTFSVKVLYGGQETKQSVSLSVAESKGFSLGFLSSMKANWLVWVIVLINLVLIVAIIIVAVKLARA